MLAVCRRSVPDEYLDQLVGEGLMQEADKSDTGMEEDFYFFATLLVLFPKKMYGVLVR
jgi:hypothetical protein